MALCSDTRTYKEKETNIMMVELDEWEANYLLDYLDEEADYTMGRVPKIRNLRDKVQTAFDKSGFNRIEIIGD